MRVIVTIDHGAAPGVPAMSQREYASPVAAVLALAAVLSPKDMNWVRLYGLPDVLKERRNVTVTPPKAELPAADPATGGG